MAAGLRPDGGLALSKQAPTCPYCCRPAELVDSAVIYGTSYGMIWLCRPCDAYVGVHRGTETPLGTLANAQLRALRRRAHAFFDRMWKNGGMTRGAAYRRLSEVMGMTKEEAHIGKFDAVQCRVLIDDMTAVLGHYRGGGEEGGETA